MPEEAICAVCRKPAIQKCGGCHAVFYCCKEHQVVDWKTHKKECSPFKVCEDSVIGRHLVATRALRKGERIIQELPLVWGPLQTTIPVCLGCGKGVNAQNSYPCQKCGWPVCSERCEVSTSHIPECTYTSECGKKVTINVFDIPNPSYQCITTLRCLYLMKFVPERWEKLNKLQSHCEERKKTDRYESERTLVAKFLRNFFKLENECSEEEILKICGIIMVNGHEVPLTKPPFVAIYEKTSMLQHNCKANCSKTFTTKGEVLITAGLPIEKGEQLSICYTDPLWGTFNRRHHLYESKFFWCLCPRCIDPTEFGTYFSCLKCKEKDCNGIAIPKSFILEQTEDTENVWICDKCSSKMTDDEAQNIVEHIGKDLHVMEKGSLEAAKKFLDFYEKSLPQNHFYLTDVRLALLQNIGMDLEEGLAGVSDDDLKLKLQLCKEVCNIVDKLAPAENRLKGMVLFELHATIAEIGRRRTNFGEADPGDFYSTIQESKKVLTEAADLLKNEPDCIREGQLYRQARFALENIDVILKNFVQANKETLI